MNEIERNDDSRERLDRLAEISQRLLARAADQGWWVAGAHLPFPCIGHVRREGRAGYAWVPAEFGPARVAP